MPKVSWLRSRSKRRKYQLVATTLNFGKGYFVQNGSNRKGKNSSLLAGCCTLPKSRADDWSRLSCHNPRETNRRLPTATFQAGKKMATASWFWKPDTLQSDRLVFCDATNRGPPCPFPLRAHPAVNAAKSPTRREAGGFGVRVANKPTYNRTRCSKMLRRLIGQRQLLRPTS